MIAERLRRLNLTVLVIVSLVLAASVCGFGLVALRDGEDRSPESQTNGVALAEDVAIAPLFQQELDDESRLQHWCGGFRGSSALLPATSYTVDFGQEIQPDDLLVETFGLEIGPRVRLVDELGGYVIDGADGTEVWTEARISCWAGDGSKVAERFAVLDASDF